MAQVPDLSGNSSGVDAEFVPERDGTPAYPYSVIGAFAFDSAQLGPQPAADSLSVVPNTQTPFPVTDNGGSLTVDGSVAISGTPTVNLGTVGGIATEATLAAASAKLPASLGTKTAAGSLSITPASDAKFMMATVAGVGSSNSTYRAVGTGYAAYATPTDMLVIRGSASKTVIVTALSMQIQSTAAALQTIYFVKRSTANTGGTATQPTPIPLDSANAAATAVVDLYTAAPTTGTLVGNILIVLASSSGLTAGGAAVSPNTASTIVDLRQPIVLRGIEESLGFNYNGAALTTGFVATWYAEWIEI